MSQIYTPTAAQSTYPNFVAPDVQDPTTYTSTSPERCDAKYIGLPIFNELLKHQELLVILGKFNQSWGDYSLTADQNDLDLAVDTYNRILITPTATDFRITGIVAPSPAGVRDIVLMNGSSSHHFHLSPEDALSTAANRLLTPDTYQSGTDPLTTIYPYDSITLSYDVTNSRWRKS